MKPEGMTNTGWALWNSAPNREQMKRHILNNLEYIQGRSNMPELLEPLRKRIETSGVDDATYWLVDQCTHYVSELDRVTSGVNTLAQLKRFWNQTKKAAKAWKEKR